MYFDTVIAFGLRACGDMRHAARNNKAPPDAVPIAIAQVMCETGVLGLFSEDQAHVAADLLGAAIAIRHNQDVAELKLHRSIER
jgi:hypothetical protein